MNSDKISNLLHAHTLDWDMGSPFRDFSQITVYHPVGGNSFVSIGWTGFVGVVAGISASYERFLKF